jgi:outer membrane protein, heavy metal efflux system
MKTIWVVLCLPLSGWAWFCAAQQADTTALLTEFDAALESRTAPAAPETLSSQPAAPGTGTNDPASSGPALQLGEVEQIALAGNPEIHVAARRVAMAEAHVPTAGTLEDPQFMYRGWGVPLNKPWDYNAAQNMFMITQTLPGRGKRGLQSSIARSDVGQAKAELESARLKVRVEVRKAFSDLLLAQGETEIHDQHVDIARQAIEAARIKYTVGKVPQQDLLKAQLALTRLAEHMIRFERDAEVARARLNTLMGRDPATPLQVSGDYEVTRALPSVVSLEQLASVSRPDLRAAQVAADKSRQEESLAKKAYTPDFAVSGGYMLMPSGSDTRNTYMVEGSVTLPWLNRHKHEAEIAEAATKATEQDGEVAAMRNEIFGQIQEALAEARAAQRLAAVYHKSLRPQADAALHAAVIAYENNQTELLDLLDSQMTVIDVDLAWRQAMGDFSARMADLELAVGAPVVEDQPDMPEEVK